MEVAGKVAIAAVVAVRPIVFGDVIPFAIPIAEANFAGRVVSDRNLKSHRLSLGVIAE